MTKERAAMYKTAIVSVDGSTFARGTCVAVKFVGAIGDDLRFECTRGNLCAVFYENELESFVL